MLADPGGLVGTWLSSDHDNADRETHEAKSRLSELIRDAEAGVDVIVARNGHPVAMIVPWPGRQGVRVPGAWSG